MWVKNLALFAAGVALLAVLFVFAMVDGGFFAWFLFYFYAGLFVYEVLAFRLAFQKVSAKRQLSAVRLTAGQSISYRLDFTRRGWWPLFWLRIETQLPAAWEFASQGRKQVLQPMWGAKFDHVVRVDGLRRGVYRFGDTVLETGDLFGLIRRRMLVESRDEVLVFPRVVPVRGWVGEHPDQAGQLTPTGRRTEESTNVLGVRDYVQGDRLSRIHWPATARRGTLQAKEFELNVTGELSFIPDFSQSSFPPGLSANVFELEMVIVASLMKYAFDSHRRYSATFLGRRLLKYGPGVEQSLLIRCLEALAAATPNGQVDFAQSLSRFAQESVPGTTLVVVSPRLDRDVAVAASLARRRMKVEWFVPALQRELTEVEKTGLSMLQAARVNVHLMASEQQLSRLHVQKGGKSIGSNR